MGSQICPLNRKLLLNADVFLTNISDYQQAVQCSFQYDHPEQRRQPYYTAHREHAKVRVKGEIDGIAQAVVRFAGAFTDAGYQYFPNSAQPVENGYAGVAPYRDVSGQPLPGAARVTFNIAPDLRFPFGGDKNIHVSFNTAYTSRYNSDNSLSTYGWIPAHSVTDLSTGFGKQRFEVNLIAKNLFNDETHQTNTWNTFTPAVPRWVGVQFSIRL